ncbi:MAG: GNAT family N-acetyltransferase [Desulfosporosinus sp.]|nr:GNAT family N-acetyltransferase [Desulfosporosinus sp.]
MLRREPIGNEFISELWETERMIIRDANLQDVCRLQEIYMQSRSTEGWTRDEEFTSEYILNAVNNGNLPPNGLKEFYRIQIITHKNSSEIMGFIECYHGYPDKEVLYIGTLLLSEDYRNNGYGQEVMNKLFKQALELRFQQARLGVTLKNWQGIYFWTKLGFNRIIKFCGDRVLAKDSFAVLELGKNL